MARANSILRSLIILSISFYLVSCGENKVSPPVDPPQAKESTETPVVYTPTSFTGSVETWDQCFDACSKSNNCNIFWNWEMQGREPAEAGRFPVYIHLVGTGDVATNPYAIAMVDRMASKGYVAASVPYDSLGGIGAVMADPLNACTIVAKKAACIFGSRPESPVSKLCARAKADCTKGIVISCHSQGSILAILAKNHDNRVRAAYALGAGIHEAANSLVQFDITPCALPEKRTLPADRLRVVNGESDYVFGVNLLPDTKALTGKNCGNNLECLNGNGSGYSFFPNSASQTDTNSIADGALVARHCYFANTPPSDCASGFTGLNTNWLDGTATYSLNPNLDWLSSFTERP